MFMIHEVGEDYAYCWVIFVIFSLCAEFCPRSCQCIPGNKPFDPEPRTGLVEGCAPLTEADKNSVMGCATRYAVEDKTGAERGQSLTGQWVPKDTFNVDRNEQYQGGYSIV